MSPERPPEGGYELNPQAELERVLQEQREALEKEYERARERMEEVDISGLEEESEEDLALLVGDRVNTFLECGAALRSLYPDRVSELDIDEELQTKIHEFGGSVGQVGEITYWAFGKMFFGDTMTTLNFKRREKDLEEYLRSILADGAYGLYAEEAAKMSILVPRHIKQYQGGSVTAESLKRDFNTVKEESGDIYEIAQKACFMKILYPDKFSELSLGENFWQHAFAEKYDEQAIYLWYLKVLAADEVKVTKKGLEIKAKK